jgi:hypothetical protein
MEFRVYDFSQPALQTRSSGGAAGVTRIVRVTKPFKLSDNDRYEYQPGERLMLQPEVLAAIVKSGCGVYQ